MRPSDALHRTPATWGLVLAFGWSLAIPSEGHGQRASGAVRTLDEHRLLISKDVGDERWAITVNRDRTVTGNVTSPSGVAFLWCSEKARDEDLATLACFRAPTDGGAACAADRWSPLGDVQVPVSFLTLQSDTSVRAPATTLARALGAAASSRQLTPDGLRVLINKDVGDERWAITLNQSDLSVNGNVLAPDGARFLSCTRASDDGAADPDEMLVVYSCAIASCAAEECPANAWSSAGSIELPASFFGGTACRGPQRASADGLLEFLGSQMDRFHDRFVVYEDVSSAGNHFPAFGKIPEAATEVAVNGSWSENPHGGATAIRFEFSDAAFGGFYLMNGVLSTNDRAPVPNFGTVPDAGFDLTGATKLTFWARGERGGELIDFFVAGVGRDSATGDPIAAHPDSSPRHPGQGALVRLTTDWRPYEIDVSSLDLSYVLGGFAWVANRQDNPQGAVFYVDDIAYELDAAARARRLAQPRFLVSFVTAPVQPDPFDGDESDDIDFVLRNLAFSYDNALVLLAFLADGTSNGLARARLIGDAFVYAAQHDRTYTDGRIRTAYAAGDIALPPGWTPNDKLGTVPVSGFYSEKDQEFFEVEQRSVDVGNNAWVMIALLAVHARTGDQSYLDAARRIGELILTFRNDAGTYQGFFGRIDYAETPEAKRLDFGSVEHNLDVASAFRAMAKADGDTRWLEAADHAQRFVEAMWDPSIGCYRAGTTDPEARNLNPGQLPLDVHPWGLLAIPSLAEAQPEILSCPERLHRTSHDGFTGFDFNEDRDGVWFEGTAHMATAYAFAERFADARALRDELARAQGTPPFGAAGGLSAACHDGVTSGFDFDLYRRLHIGASSWAVFGQLGFNPYQQTWSGE